MRLNALAYAGITRIRFLKEKVSLNGYNLSPSFSRIKEPYHSARHPIIAANIGEQKLTDFEIGK